MSAEELGKELGRTTGLIRSLRARKVACPIIIYTTLDGDFYETAVLDAGADDYILSTRDFSVLIARLMAHLRRRAIAVEAERRTIVGPYILDHQAVLLLCGGKSIKLRLNELALLEILAINSHRWVPHNEALDVIWGGSLRRSEKRLRTLIQSLKKSFALNGLANPIETDRFLGIRLSPKILSGTSASDFQELLHQSYLVPIDT